MGLAMRVARYLLMVVVSLVCQAAIPFTACASDSAAVDMSEQSSEPQAKGRFTDDAVQQASYYDSRTRPNTTRVSQPNSGPNQPKRTLLGGNSITSPKSWFGRPTQTQN